MTNNYIQAIEAIKKINKSEITPSKIISAIEEHVGSDLMLLESGEMPEISEVDLNMIPIINQLNRLGLKTSFSCGGHLRIYNSLKWIYKLALRNAEDYLIIYDSIKELNPIDYSLVSYLYVVIGSDNLSTPQVLIPSGGSWFMEEDPGKVTLRCHVAKNISLRDEYLNDLFIHLSKIESL